jgi:1-phosphofructokinase family hexose kinase
MIDRLDDSSAEERPLILAAGLSPAWQHVIVLEHFRLGEVNRVSELHTCASGKVLNVGLALHHLSGGDSAKTLTVAPVGGAVYDLVEDDLSRLGVPHRFVRTRAPTRICTTVLDRRSNLATELVQNANPTTADELYEFTTAFADAARQASAVVLTGSTPPGTPTDIFRLLLAAAPCPAVLDVRGDQLLAALDSRPFLIKPNREELAATLGRSVTTDDDLQAAMRELHRRGAACVVVTSGEDAVWVLANGQFHQLLPRPVDHIVNPIGCGDCLAAGIAWALGHGAEPVDAVSQGMELAAKNIQTLLPARFGPSTV